MITAIETIRSVARRAAEDPVTTKAPDMTATEQARIDLLRQERDSRAAMRRLGMKLVDVKRVRPDRPPADHRAATPPAVAPPSDKGWHDLLDLTSDALETFICRRDTPGIRGCLALLDLFADTCDADRPEAA